MSSAGSPPRLSGQPASHVSAMSKIFSKDAAPPIAARKKRRNPAFVAARQLWMRRSGQAKQGANVHERKPSKLKKEVCGLAPPGPAPASVLL